MLFIRRGKKAGRPTDGTMSLMEHLYELRRRLVYAVLGIVAGAILGFIWYGNGIPAIGLRSLGDILVEPYCGVPTPPRQILDGGCRLLANGPFDILGIRLKAAIMSGTVVSCPIWLYQVWAFVTPALYHKERRFAVTFVTSAAVLFVVGALLAYIVIPEGLKVLLGFGGDTTVAALSPQTYYSFLIALLIVFGLSFEVPLLLVMLNFAGVIKGEKLAKSRRYAIFGMVVLAALVVPGNDPITMTALALSLSILYEVAVQISKIHDKRKAKRLAAEGLGDLSDDEASPAPAPSAAPSGPGTVAPPKPVDSRDDPFRDDPFGDDPFGDAT